MVVREGGNEAHIACHHLWFWFLPVSSLVYDGYLKRLDVCWNPTFIAATLTLRSIYLLQVFVGKTVRYSLLYEGRNVYVKM